MEPPVCLVTGATSGIGLATATAMAARGARVVIGARSLERGSPIAETIRQHTGNAMVEVLAGDFASLEAVQVIARECQQRFPGLSVLINNAGVQTMTRRLTRDGFEETFQVNYLAPFLLTALLLESLTANAPARIINVASVVHRWARLDFADLQSERFETNRAYYRSKLAQVMFSLELARRLAGTDVTVNALEPGLVDTAFARDFSGIMALGNRLMRPFKKTPAAVAADITYLALAPELEGVTGAYFAGRRRLEPSRAAQRSDDAERLWDISCQLVRLEKGVTQ